MSGVIEARDTIPPPRPFGWAPWLAAVALLLLMSTIYFAGRERDYATELARARQQMRQQSLELARNSEAFAILGTADASETAFSLKGVTGKVYAHATRGVALVVSDLPPVPAGKRYQMWVIPDGGKPVPAGLFQPDRNGFAIHVQRGPLGPGAIRSVEVTLEDEAGAPEPTTAPVIVTAMPPNYPAR